MCAPARVTVGFAASWNTRALVAQPLMPQVATVVNAALLSVPVAALVFAGLFAAYLVFSGMTTVKPLPGVGRRFDVALMALAFFSAAVSLYGGVAEWLDPAVVVAPSPDASESSLPRWSCR